MKKSIPIFIALVAILPLAFGSFVKAQEIQPQTPWTKESLVAVSAPVTMIHRDPLGFMMPGDNVLNSPQSSPNQASSQPAYEISTSEDDPLCDTGFGGYVNLEDLGIFPWLGVEGNNVAWGPFFNNVGPIKFFGVNYNDLWITDDGIVLFDVHKNFHRSWMPQHIANPALPNNVIAPLWQDMEIVEDRKTNRGVTAAQTPDGSVLVVEFDDLQLVGSPKNRYDVEVVIQRKVSHRPGVYEIVFAYDNLQGPLTGPLTIGLENWAGTTASAFVNLGDATGVIKDGLMVCFNAVAGSAPENPPQDVDASDGEFSHMVQISWEGVDEAATYEVYRSTDVDDSKTKLGHAEDLFFNDLTAQPETKYVYWVTTCNTYGCSEESEYDIGWRAASAKRQTLLHYFPFIKQK
jgi:hypothetical protein